MGEYFYFRNHLCITFELLWINLYELLKRNNFQVRDKEVCDTEVYDTEVYDTKVCESRFLTNFLVTNFKKFVTKKFVKNLGLGYVL